MRNPTHYHRRRTARLAAVAAIAAGSLAAVGVSAAASPPQNGNGLRTLVGQRLGDTRKMSAGAQMWLHPPKPPTGAAPATRGTSVRFGTNVDANNPNRDAAAGQSETAIAAQRSRSGRRLVMAGWNDVSSFFHSPTTPQGSATGVGISDDGGASFTDLIGLPNNDVDEQWSGDPSITSLDDGIHFAVASLYYPSGAACNDGLPAYGTVAISIATVRSTSGGPTASFTAPIVLADPGNLCLLFTHDPPKQLASFDKDWISYDPASRTLAVSYTRFFIPVFTCTPETCTPSGHSGDGQIEVARAHVPARPTTLTTADFTKPTVVWPEEPLCPDGVPESEQLRCGAVNQGAYVSVATGGATYVAWERNVDSNLYDGDSAIYEHAAVIPPGATAPTNGGLGHPVVLTQGQRHSNSAGGVKSLDAVAIAGYSRVLGNDFPRLTADSPRHRVLFEWNDASRHPLGDIWLRTATPGLGNLGPIRQVDDGNSYALHFMPAVSVRGDGTICSSWYDRRRGGSMSTLTDYYAECRTHEAANAPDVRISTGSTDWAGTGSLIDPNFGDYTDNATDGTRTYFTWSDGRLGVPQPFVDSR